MDNHNFLKIAFNLQHGINNKKKLKKTPVWKYPWGIEKEYEIAMVQYIKNIEHWANELIIPVISTFKAEYEFNRNVYDSESLAYHEDDYESDLKILFETLQMRVAQEAISPEILTIDIGNKANKWNSKEWQNILKTVLGVKGFAQELGIQQTMNNFVNSNIALIQNLNAETIRKIKLIFNNGIAQSQRVETITKNIEHSLGISESRARLIARDQIGKLNGALTMDRQTTYGISHYIWMDSNDTRVRPTHTINNEHRFAWNTPPPTGHPGFDYQCRCWGAPDFSTIGL